MVQVDNFYFPVDFIVLDTDPTIKEANLVPIILGRPFLATSNAIINYRNGLMQLTFGNMTLDLNIFYMSKKQTTPEEEEGPEELCIIDTLVEEHCIAPPTSHVKSIFDSWLPHTNSSQASPNCLKKPLCHKNKGRPIIIT